MTTDEVARRTGRFPQLFDPRSSVNGLLSTGSPRSRLILYERRRACAIKAGAGYPEVTGLSRRRPELH